MPLGFYLYNNYYSWFNLILNKIRSFLVRFKNDKFYLKKSFVHTSVKKNRLAMNTSRKRSSVCDYVNLCQSQLTEMGNLQK